jgi:Domain of unknown function (DUF4062)
MEEKLKVFVSSVIRDDELREERTTACQKIETYMDILQPICFDFTHPESIPPQDWSLENVQNCHIFIQLLDKTITDPVKNEYKTAKNKNKPRIILLKRNSARDPELDGYIGSIRNDIKYGEFSHLAEFEKLVKGGLEKAVLNLALGKDNDARTESIRDFRRERTKQRHFRNDEDLPLSGHAETILHLIPADTIVVGQQYDVDLVFRDAKALKPMFRQGFGSLGPHPSIERQIKLDRIVKCSYYVYLKKGKEDATETVWTPYTKVQLFTKGIIEASERILLNSEYVPNPKRINIDWFENGLITCLDDYLNSLQLLGVTPPIFLFLTLLGVQGYELSKSWTIYPQVFGGTIDRYRLDVPERIIPEYGTEATTLLKPCFDSIWKACGYPRSMNYDTEGNYRPQDSQAQLDREVSQFLEKS